MLASIAVTTAVVAAPAVATWAPPARLRSNAKKSVSLTVAAKTVVAMAAAAPVVAAMAPAVRQACVRAHAFRPVRLGKSAAAMAVAAAAAAAAADRECSYSTKTCECPFFSTVEYTFTLDPTADWSNVFGVVLNVQHIDLAGDLGQTDSGFFCDRDTCPGGVRKTSWKKTVRGCEPNLRIRRQNDFVGGSPSCTSDETIAGSTQFTIPLPVDNGDFTCTAPAL